MREPHKESEGPAKPQLEPNPIPIVFAQHELDYASDIAMGRNRTGGESRPLDSGYNAIEGDYLGALAEIAVCLAYDEPYERFVTVYKKRPGAIADLTHQGLSVSVKGSTYFNSPDLIVPSYDTNNDIYMLVNVDTKRGFAQIRGWVEREILLEHEPEEWKWTTNRPGTDKPKKRRYVPLFRLRQCRPVANRFDLIIR